MVVFGGGNEGIVDELHVYNTGKRIIPAAVNMHRFSSLLAKNITYEMLTLACGRFWANWLANIS